jgi:hypothetical protein
MAKHYIHYIPRHVKLRTTAEQLTDTGVEEARAALNYLQPAFHRTGMTTGIVKAVQPGDTIWLLGQLSTPWGPLGPSLDARIDVAACTLGAKESVFLAAKTSKWFPLAQASALIAQLQLLRRNGTTAPLRPNPARPVGIYLQQMHQLANAEALCAWADAVDAQGYDFVSYRHQDGTRAAYDRTAALLNQGKAVFWDRWSLPRQLAERGQQVPETELKNHLTRLISQAKQVWGIDTNAFGEAGSFSAYERAVAEKLGIFALSSTHSPDSF